MSGFREGLGVFRTLFMAGLRSQLEYRVSFLFSSLATFLLTGSEFVAIYLLFQRFPTVVGWHFHEIAVLYGLAGMSLALGDALGSGHDRLGLLIREGDFDRLLLRPQSLTLQIMAPDVTLRRLGRFVQATGALTFGLLTSEVELTAAKVALLVMAVVSGTAIFLGLWIVQATLAFFTIESLEALHVLTYGGAEVSQYPLSIYTRWMRTLFIAVVPLGFAVYFPALVVLGKVDPLGTPAWLGWVAPLAGPAFLILALFGFQLGVRRYTSTGS